jgi:RecA-family ATPase
MIKMCSLGWLVEHEPPKVPSLWGESLLPMKGLTMIHSASKQGKSMLGLNIALAGAASLPSYLGYALPKDGFNTMIFQGEIHQRGVWERATTMITHMAKIQGYGPQVLDRIMINEERNIRLAQSEMWDEFLAVVRFFKPAFVLLDPLAHVLTEDENSNVVVGAMLEKIAILRDNPGCAIGLIHHDSKPNDSTSGRAPRQRTRGADRLNADPDSILSLVPLRAPEGQGPTSRLEPTSRYSRTPPPVQIWLNEDTLWFERVKDMHDDGHDPENYQW